jgi:hypothetical protein
MDQGQLQALAAQLPGAPLSQIADTIRRDWKPMNYAAVPYVQAMLTLPSIESSYGADDGKSIVLYFLSNASTWRGPVAKLVKAELKKRAGVK